MFPTAFESQMRRLLGDDEWISLAAALQEPPPVSIRRNPVRQPADISLLPASDGAVPWNAQGQYLAERPVFTLDPLFHTGAYYVQEASSMFVHEVLRQTGRLNQAGRFLDFCAAPGGKTSLLHDALNRDGNGLLVANEVVPQRTGVLRENLERWGVDDAAVLSASAEKWSALESWFDVVLVDAPCSGEGMFRKDPDSIREWSPDNVAMCATRQEQILEELGQLVAPGGLLLYSTCTYNPAENEDNFQQFIEKTGFEPVKLSIPAEWGIENTGLGYQFFPHKVRGEGFFIAAAIRSVDAEPAGKKHTPASFGQITPLPRKQAQLLTPWLEQPDKLSFWNTPSGEILALPVQHEAYFRTLDPLFRSKWFGSPIGSIKGNDLIPSHALALSRIRKQNLPMLELSREEALIFLKKETFPLPADAPKGWVLAAYSGLALGWMKVMPNRMNNYLPQERRIRMDLR